MDTIRTFIAINFSEEVIKKVSKIRGVLREYLPNNYIKWVPVDKMHITLKFLGEKTLAEISQIKSILDATKEIKIKPHAMVGHLGAYPSLKKPRVIWIGISPNNDMLLLHQFIEQKLGRLNIKSDTRHFSPHLTLARVSRQASDSEVVHTSKILSAIDVTEIGVDTFHEIHLYESRLTGKGYAYSILHTVNI